MNREDQEVWLTVAEVAALLKIGPEAVRRLRAGGVLVGRQDARGHWRFCKADIQRKLGEVR